MAAETFVIVPANPGPLLWVFVPLVLVLGFVVFLLAQSIVGSRSARFVVSDEGVRIVGDMYGPLVPAAQVRSDAARVVDLTREPSLRPARRSFGTGMPGYAAGWFRLAGGERALVYLTEPRLAVYVPTTAGYALVLSPRDPDAFVERVRAISR